MLTHRRSARLSLIVLSLLVQPPATGSAVADEGTKSDHKVAGIMIDRQKDWITVKADGEDQSVKYVVDPADQRLQEVFKSVFNASRVQLNYRTEGDTRHLVSIKRQILKASGTMTGTVVQVHNKFWIEVKPKTGLADAFAPDGNDYNSKEFMERLNALQPGDSVTISYTTDFERHRIKTLRKNAVSPSKSACREQDETLGRTESADRRLRSLPAIASLLRPGGSATAPAPFANSNTGDSRFPTSAIRVPGC